MFVCWVHEVVLCYFLKKEGWQFLVSGGEGILFLILFSICILAIIISFISFLCRLAFPLLELVNRNILITHPLMSCKRVKFDVQHIDKVIFIRKNHFNFRYKERRLLLNINYFDELQQTKLIIILESAGIELVSKRKKSSRPD